MAKPTSPVRTDRKPGGKQKGKNKETRIKTDPKKQIKIQKALYEIATAASAVTDMQEFYNELHRIVEKLMYAKNFYVTLYDPATQMISTPYFVDETGDVLPAPGRLEKSNKSLRGVVLHTGRTLHVSAEEIDKGRRLGRFTPMGNPAEDWIGVPLKMSGRVIGSLTIQSYKKGIRYEDHDIQLLEFVAQHIAVALTRARAIDETRQRNAELSIINSVQASLAAKLDIQGIYEAVGDKIREIFHGTDMGIRIYDPKTNMVSYPYTYEKGQRIHIDPWPLPQHGFGPHVLRTRKSLMINENLVQEMEKYGSGLVPGTIQSKSLIVVPLVIDNQVRGIIDLTNVEHEHAFKESDVRLLETLANSMSVALENAHLFDETQRLLKETNQRNVELQIINSVQEGLASNLDLHAIYELIGEKVREVFNVQVVDIVVYDPVTNLLSMPYSYEKGDRSVFSPREPYGFREQVIQSGAPLLINQNFVELASQSNNPLLTGEWPKSALFVPLLVDGRVKNIISIQDLDRENAFSASDVQLLQTLSNAMSVALENAWLFEETERRAQELSTVNAVSAALVSELDLNKLIELVGEQIRSIFRADIVFVALLDKENNIINFPYQYGEESEPIQLGQGITSRIIQSSRPLLINQNMDRQRDEMGVTLIGTRAQSFLGIPIFVGGESIGVVSVQSTKQEGRFTENDQRLLTTIASNVGIAFQNARLFDETERLFKAEKRAHQQAEILRSIAQALNRSLSLSDVLNLVLTEIQKVIPYDSAGIYQVQGNRRILVAGRGFTNLDDLVGVSFEFNQQDDEIGYRISQSLQPLILEDALEQYPQYFDTGAHAPAQIRGYMAVPIVLGQNLIGMITLDKNEPDFYKEEHAKLAMAFAAQAATAINNAQLFDETQRLLKETEQRNTELAIINSVQDGLVSRLDIRAIYELVGEKIRNTFNAQVVSIDTYDRASQLLHSRYYFEGGRSIPGTTYPFFGFRKHVIENRRSLVINSDMSQWMEEYGNPVNLGVQPKSAVFVPMILGDEAMGVISLQNNDQENAFSEADLRLLTTLANSMSVALENARLWEEEKKYRKALERELEIGREIQNGFLPEALPQVEGWEIAASLMSAREVAGDFYDAFELPDGNIGFVIADVCDKGVGAALFMTLFRSLIRATANMEYFDHDENALPPQSTPERLKHSISLTNNYIAETHGESGMFATLFFGILDPHDGRLFYINGGHEPPLIIRSGRVLEALRKTGPAVGAIPDRNFAIHESQFQRGDLLLAFTDGVMDCQNPRGDFYEREQLLKVLQGAGDSSRQVIKAIEEDLHHHTAGANQFDDITLLAVRRG